MLYRSLYGNTVRVSVFCTQGHQTNKRKNEPSAREKISKKSKRWLLEKGKEIRYNGSIGFSFVSWRNKNSITEMIPNNWNNSQTVHSRPFTTLSLSFSLSLSLSHSLSLSLTHTHTHTHIDLYLRYYELQPGKRKNSGKRNITDATIHIEYFETFWNLAFIFQDICFSKFKGFRGVVANILDCNIPVTEFYHFVSLSCSLSN